jgi:ABC-type Fe3+-siderophore transport system permease subunit
MVPHAARSLLGGDSARVIPGAALIGAIALA